MSKGYVYILTNPCIQYTFRDGAKDVTISPVKIGMAKDVEKRLGSLNTSLPENFVHHMSVFSNDSKALENIVHRLLANYRIDTKHGDRTEFFRCSVEDAVAVLKQTAKDMHLKEYKIDKSKLIGRSSCKIKSNSKAAREAKRPRERPTTALASWVPTPVNQSQTKRPNFSFAEVGIPVGAELVFTEAPIKVKVAEGKNKVIYKGEPYSLSGFVREFNPNPNASGAYQGPKFFTYNGVLLVDLRKTSDSTSRNTSSGGESACRQVWKTRTELAKHLAKTAGNPKAANGILQQLSGKRRVVKDSKWRKPMEDAGVKFDKNDMVISW